MPRPRCRSFEHVHGKRTCHQPPFSCKSQIGAEGIPPEEITSFLIPQAAVSKVKTGGEGLGKYISRMKLRPIHWGAVVKNPMRHLATRKLVLLGARVANNVMHKDINIDHQRTGRRPYLWVNGAATNPPIPSICC
jgi:hypothetical protein